MGDFMTNSNGESLVKLQEAIDTLRAYGLPVKGVQDALTQRVEDDKRVPDEADRRWSVGPVPSIEDHLSMGDGRPTLGCGMVVGRAYELTPGQRDVLRERFGMTPSRLVRVDEVAMFDGGQMIKRVILHSEEHVPSNRRHLMVAVVIDHWGEFMDAAQAKDAQRAECHVEKERVVGATTKVVKKATRSLEQLLSEYDV
jgi:hypothetical protein